MSHSVRVNRKSVSWLEPRNWWFKKLKRYNENFQFPLRYLSLVQKLSDFINQKNDDSLFRLNECRNECSANLKSWKSETYFEFSVQRYFRQIAPRVMCCVLSWKLFHFKMPGSEGIWSNCATILPRVSRMEIFFRSTASLHFPSKDSKLLCILMNYRSNVNVKLSVCEIWYLRLQACKTSLFITPEWLKIDL